MNLFVKIRSNVEGLQKLLEEAKELTQQLEEKLEEINNFSLEAEIEPVNEKSE